jgi:putative tryptophan/tyrosine transport system substrate-binding protein
MQFGQLKRREFISLLGATAAWPIAGHAQRPDEMRIIGCLLHYTESDLEGNADATGFREELQKFGWVDGRNIRIEYRWNGGDPARAKDYAAELVALKPYVILASSTLSLRAVRKETGTIPIVFVGVGDPVGQGFVTSLARPGGNITGFTAFEFSTAAKWLELLREIAPQAKRIAVIFNAEAAPYAKNMLQAVATIAPSLEAELVVDSTRDAVEIERAIAVVAGGSNGGLIVIPDAFTVANRGVIISLAARYRLPAIYAYRYYAVDGRLLSYGHQTNDLFRRSASYVDRILRGEKPADMPIQLPTKYELVINLKTARALGINVPDKLLSLADEVIE